MNKKRTFACYKILPLFQSLLLFSFHSVYFRDTRSLIRKVFCEAFAMNVDRVEESIQVSSPLNLFSSIKASTFNKVSKKCLLTLRLVLICFIFEISKFYVFGSRKDAPTHVFPFIRRSNVPSCPATLPH